MDFEKIFSTIKDGVAELAKNTVGDFADQAKSDADDFLTESRENLKRWTQAASEGKLTKPEYEFLLQMQVSVGKMHALKAAGVGIQRLNRFREGVISLVIKSVFSAI